MWPWAGTADDGFAGYDGVNEGGGGAGYDEVDEGSNAAGGAEQYAPEGVETAQDSHNSLGPASSLQMSTELGRQVRASHPLETLSVSCLHGMEFSALPLAPVQAGGDPIQWLLQGALSAAAGEEPSASACSLPGASWAGASHWRYRAAPTGTAEATSRPAAGGRWGFLAIASCTSCA